MEKNTKIFQEDAVKIIYYLMAVDGEICQADERKFEDIAKELDSAFEFHRSKILETCKNQLSKARYGSEYYNVIQEGVGAVIRDSRPLDVMAAYGLFQHSQIDNKVLVWNLLTIAFSDNRYSENERKLIKYVVRQLNLDEIFFLEMEYTIKALNAIENEKRWLRTTSKPYDKIERLIQELENREGVINNSINELIVP